jgi:hypothetical protein
METYPPTPSQRADTHLRFLGKMILLVLGSWLTFALFVIAGFFIYAMMSIPTLGPYRFVASEAGNPYPSDVYFKGAPLRHSDGSVVTADVAARTPTGLALLNLNESSFSQQPRWRDGPVIIYVTDFGSVQVFASFRELEAHCRMLGYEKLEWCLTRDVSPVNHPQSSLPERFR